MNNAQLRMNNCPHYFDFFINKISQAFEIINFSPDSYRDLIIH